MAKAKKDIGAMLDAGSAFGKQNADKRRELEAVAGARVEASTLPASKILPRAGGDARSLDPWHVLGLVHSIGTRGLVQPLAVDRLGRLLAGAHRLEAIRILEKEGSQRRNLLAALEDEANVRPAKSADEKAERDELRANAEAAPQWREGVPVHRIDFDAAQDPDRALALEFVENDQRRDFTPGDVLSLRDKLLALGYRDTGGRPKKGEKALVPALASIVGKSRRTLFRILADDPAKGAEAETVPSVTVSDPVKAMRRARSSARSVVDALAGSRGKRAEVRAAARALAEAVDAAINEESAE